MNSQPSTTDLRVLFAAQDITESISDVTPNAQRFGGMADIHQGVWASASGNQAVAIKFIRSRDDELEKTLRRHRREITVWHNIDHPNILRFLGLYWSSERKLPAMVSMWCPHTNLRLYVKEHLPGSDVMAQKYTLLKHVISGLAHLHNQTSPIVHGDLKGDNILVSEDAIPKICDFGLSRIPDVTTETSTRVRGTLRWMAPELLIDDMSSTAGDIWAYACVIVEVLTGLLPYSTIQKDHGVVVALSRRQIPARPADASDACWDLALKCFAFIPAERPSANELLNEPLFALVRPSPISPRTHSAPQPPSHHHAHPIPFQVAAAVSLPITSPSVINLDEPPPYAQRDPHRPRPLPARLTLHFPDAGESTVGVLPQPIPAGARMNVSLFGTAGREVKVEVLSAEVHGCGTSAFILRGQLLHPPQWTWVALKVFCALLSSADRTLLSRELEACSQVQHAHILAFIGTATWGNQPILVAPYMKNGNLTKYLKAHPLADRAALMLQVAHALHFLHDNARPRRVHGDLNCENVLVSDDGHALLADFGLTTTREKTETDPPTPTEIRYRIGTLRFAAPELVLERTEESKTTATDVYAFGMLMFQVFSGEVPWSGMDELKVIMEVARGQAPPRPRVGFTDEHWNLCLKCWSQNPELRPDMGRVVRTLERLGP